MPTVVSELYGAIRIPGWVVDPDSFCRWVGSADLPEKLSVHFIRGEVWVDLSMEEMFSHNQVKTALGITLGALIQEGHLGIYTTDGMQFASESAGIVTNPDAMYLSNESLRTKRVGFVAGKKTSATATRIVGIPDLVIEVISPSSEDKDTEWLMSAYWNAGIPEYWLVDARDDELGLKIYKRGLKGYPEPRRVDGWSKSAVLKRSFRLTSTTGPHGYPVYHLEHR